MGYVSDWDEWARHAAEAQALHPLCDGTADCPAGDGREAHDMNCRHWRSLYAMTPYWVERRKATDAS